VIAKSTRSPASSRYAARPQGGFAISGSLTCLQKSCGAYGEALHTPARLHSLPEILELVEAVTRRLPGYVGGPGAGDGKGQKMRGNWLDTAAAMAVAAAFLVARGSNVEKLTKLAKRPRLHTGAALGARTVHPRAADGSASAEDSSRAGIHPFRS
jgi:hypothetical protein